MGQTFSYLYIQGDKETPIYVKMEDEMQPRYGKNYCIISQLAPGPVHIQILFQQNTYPAQNFILQVPDKGYRGFIVTHKGDNFSLFDLQQKIYIPAGNSIADDVAPEAHNYVTTASTTTATITPPTDNTVVPVAKSPDNNTVIPDEPKPADTPPSPSTDDIAAKKAHIDSLVATEKHKKVKKETPQQSTQPQFIDNLVLDNERTVQAGKIQNVTVDEPKAAITNSDCPTPMDNGMFEDIYVKMREKSDDDRLKYLLQNTKHCFSCNQVQILAKNLDSDSQRYSFMKQVYPHVTDQSHFKFLENLFTSAEWKSYFLLIAQ